MKTNDNLEKYKYINKIKLNDFIKDAQLIKYKNNIISDFNLQSKEFITKSESLKILDKYKNSVVKKINETFNNMNNNSNVLDKEKKTKNKKINFIDNSFIYENVKFSFIINDDKIYFNGENIANFLEYANSRKTINEHVDKNEILILDEKNIIYITEFGLYKLVSLSKKKEAEEFKKFIMKNILPKFNNSDSYILEKKIVTNTNFISSFYDANNMCDYVDCNVVYLGVIGTLDNNILIKYGKSSRVYEREYIEHKTTFGNQFKIIHIIKTDNNEKVENLFKQTIKSKKLHKKIFFNGKVRDELFITNDDFTIEKAKELLLQIVNDNPTKEIKNRDDKIKKLESINENILFIEKEKTKQKEFDLKNMEEITKQLELKIQLKLLENNQLKLLENEQLKINNKQNNNEKKITDKNNNSNDNKLLSIFEITPNKKDILTLKEINNAIKQNNIKIKKKELKLFLLSNGTQEYKNNKSRGIRYIQFRKKD